MRSNHFRLSGDDPTYAAPSKELKPLAVKELHVLSLLNQAFTGVTIALTAYCLIVNRAPTALNILQLLMIIVPILVSYLTFYHVRSGILFLLFHAAAIIGPYFYLPMPVAVIHTIIMIPLTIVKMYDALHPLDHPVADPGLYYLVFYLGCSWANTGLSGPSFVNTLCIFGALVCLLCSAITMYYRELTLFIKVNAEQTSLPVGQIRRTSRILIGIFLAVVTIVILLLPAGGIAKLTALLHRGLLSILIVVLALLFPYKELPEDQQLLPQEETERIFEEIVSTSDQIPTWLYNLMYAISSVIIVLIIIGVIAGLLYALYAFLRGFHVLAPKEEHTDYTETSERIKPKTKHRLTASERANPTYQIRKLYKRSILHLKKKTQLLNESNTPIQIENDVHMPDTEDRKVLHRIYEKARYSRDGVTIEEADRAFQASRTLRNRVRETMTEENEIV